MHLRLIGIFDHLLIHEVYYRTASGFQLGRIANDGDVFDLSPIRAGGSMMAGNDNSLQSAGLNEDIARTTSTSLTSDAKDEFMARLTANASPPILPSDLSQHRNASDSSVFLSTETHYNNGLTRNTSSFHQQSPGSLALRIPSEPSSRYQVGGVDAQAFYSPLACVFVAKSVLFPGR